MASEQVSHGRVTMVILCVLYRLPINVHSHDLGRVLQSEVLTRSRFRRDASTRARERGDWRTGHVIDVTSESWTPAAPSCAFPL